MHQSGNVDQMIEQVSPETAEDISENEVYHVLSAEPD